MNKRVWIFQYPNEVKRKGIEKASHYVGWYDSNGQRHAESCGAGARGKQKADQRKRKIQSELDMGMHQPPSKKKWADFRKEYEEKIYPNLARQSREQVSAVLNHFERIVKPRQMSKLTTQTIDAFVAVLRTERGKNRGSTMSIATINKDLRHIKAVLRKAVEWERLPKMPRIKLLREPEKLKRYVTQEHFDKLYQDAAFKANLPKNPGQAYESSVWWQALLATAYMTGWRIRELLALRTEDVDVLAKTLITRHADNKGRRDAKVPVHATVIEHLQKVMGNGTFVFAWTHGAKKLWDEFRRIQKEAGIHLACREEHEHTPACHVYGFHDFRRAFATTNAKNMKPEVLQQMMRHKSYTTTLGYINLAEQMQDAAKSIRTPATLSRTTEANPPTVKGEQNTAG